MFILKNQRTGEYYRMGNKHDTYNMRYATKFTFGTKLVAEHIIKHCPQYKLTAIKEARVQLRVV